MKSLVRVSVASAAMFVLTLNAVMGQAGPTGKYAAVNGLKMYYEVHGQGKPIVLLHGSFGYAAGWTPLLPALTKKHKVIIVELQGHGRTGDIDRPLSSEGMAEDVAALIKHLNLKRVDVFGYSMGGTVAFSLVVKHPELVGKLAVLGSGTGATKDTFEPEMYKILKSMTPENFNYAELKDPYTKLAPDPSKWPVLVSKMIKMDDNFKGIPTKDVKAIKAPTLIMMGDHEGIRLEHAVEMFRMIPNAQLAIFPGGDHFLLFMNPNKVLGTLVPFLDSATPAK
jgi:pimeloyl-ACP methyl ester carboxylesterase